MQKMRLGSKKLTFLRYALLAYLFVFSNFSLFSIPTTELLNRIPLQDRKELEELFCCFIQRTTFAYTLFGDKPVSWLVISLPEFSQIRPSKKIIHRQSERIPLWSRWKIWKQYEKSFNLKKYLLIEDSYSNSLVRKDIFLINKKEFIKTVDLHKKLFQEVLKREISGQSLLEEIELKNSLNALFADKDVLLGILMGFGVYNSKLYQMREDASSNYRAYESIVLKDMPCLKNLERKIERLTETLEPIDNLDLVNIGSVQFVADKDSPKTQSLLFKYINTREKIFRLYSQGHYLEVTLLGLIRD